MCVKKYDDEITKLKKARKNLEDRITNAEIERDRVVKPHDEKRDKLHKEFYALDTELSKVELNRKIYLRNLKLKKNKDLFKDGMTFEDLVLTGKGSFSDYRYFLKNGLEVVPEISLSRFDYVGDTEDIRIDLDVPEGHEVVISGIGDRYDIEFNSDIPISFVRETCKKGWLFWSGWWSTRLEQGKDTIEVKNPDNYKSYKHKKISEMKVIPKETSDEG